MSTRSRRMIGVNICTSEKLQKISWQARLLFTWMILHCDDEGRMQGNPTTVKALVFPMADCTVDQVGEWLGEMKKSGLICWYKVGKDKYIAVKKWEEFQTFHGIRKIPSVVPAPTLVDRNTKIGANISNTRKKERKKFDISKLKNIGKKLEAGLND